MEKTIKPQSGYFMVFVAFCLLALIAFSVFGKVVFLLIPAVLIFAFIISGFFIVEPNKAMVLLLFGSYKGTVKDDGFFWVIPFMTKKKISLRVRNFENKPLKVNDKIGNPVMVGTIVVWQVADTFKASFDVDDYENFVHLQADAAVRKMAGTYPYDNFEDEHAEITLRSGVEDVNKSLEDEISDRLQHAGIKVIEARISHLAYSSEIASAMLQRQQATAIVAARRMIVDGAVGMVEMALEDLKIKGIIDFEDEKKAAMVSNLMVVLCSDKNASPVVNVGTLNQ
ncbi:SPFH domain-containing protein [Cyclobacterium marinum]|uniref:Band 7 protein n=1 Tax=Cyclobacterium marinum (strain ATCC 25205 / DSM 745 / LMG 13164 / NCIMB 1802) TaxID=880070 RepID=G0J226_CYCMS|nr:SPFH domain-containing protein [Cyclobacterium marinum]AEL24535.1 band 7 protein [Cyclobacterium marinum DSM 745]MBI0399195.1 SPFH domain-containing protein [Cyclobacterium marinum]|tara:strand:- start:34092 stop:34940 length:849 start_codon:yes stop_codon:yes gene_type:complete